MSSGREPLCQVSCFSSRHRKSNLSIFHRASLMFAVLSVCVSGLCSLRDGPVTDSEGVIRNPAYPGDHYDNNQ